MENGIERKFRCRLEDFKNETENSLPYTSILIPYQISHIVFAEKYKRIVIYSINVFSPKCLADNHLSTKSGNSVA